MDKKKSGSYYTPQRLANLVADYCLSRVKPQEAISIIEPSVGDGVFINAISNSKHLKHFSAVNITAVEINAAELEKTAQMSLGSKITLNSFNRDYLHFHFQDTKKYSLYIGNPPYVKKNHLSEEQKKQAELIHAEKGLSKKKINNIWTSFLISGIDKLEPDGILALILPLELLQVKFTEEIRTLLKDEFERIEIFTFNELQFQECKGQDTVLLIGYKISESKGTYYTNIISLDALETTNYLFYQNTALANSGKKWTHHFITPNEYDFLEGLKHRLNNVSHYVNNKPGIVTAANDYFIVNRQTVKNYNLQYYARPVLQKGAFVNGSIAFEEEHFEHLVSNEKPTYLLDFNGLEDEESFKASITDYLKIGIDRNIPDRYKCRQRTDWYKVPNISDVPQAFFFKRTHEYPKLLCNDAKVLVTDSAYKVELKPGFELSHFVFSFYNSLTLTFAELEGRYFGGGVLELTPNEFRVLPIPYVAVNDFNQYKLFFENKDSIEDVLKKYNYLILNTALGLNYVEIDRLESIRKKLVNKRKRNN